MSCDHPDDYIDVDHEPSESVIVCLACSKILYKVRNDYLGRKVVLENWQDEMNMEVPF